MADDNALNTVYVPEMDTDELYEQTVERLRDVGDQMHATWKNMFREPIGAAPDLPLEEAFGEIDRLAETQSRLLDVALRAVRDLNAELGDPVQVASAIEMADAESWFWPMVLERAFGTISDTPVGA
jgi:hypothetical protein